MLAEWATKGFASEADLFGVRAVLQYCCRQDLKSANAVLAAYRKEIGEDSNAMKSPLVNFAVFGTSRCDALRLSDLLLAQC